MNRVLVKLSIVLLLNQSQVFAGEKHTTTATIACAGGGSSDLNYANGQIHFPQGYYETPNLKRIAGYINLSLPFETSKSFFTVTGYHIDSRTGEAEHWIMYLQGRTGEKRQFILSKSPYDDHQAFGYVELEKGDLFSARCEITMHFPPSPNGPQRCPSHGC